MDMCLILNGQGRIIIIIIIIINASSYQESANEIVLLDSKYRVIQDEMLIFWEVRKKVRMDMCLIPSVCRDRGVWIYKFKRIVNDKEREIIYC
jgi:hypothetical protein